MEKLLNEIKSQMSEDPWDGCKNQWIKMKPPKVKGQISEKIVREVFKELGYEVKKSKGTDSDLIINGEEVEVKMSCCAMNKGKPSTFTFFQIRPLQKYNTIVFVCVCPNDIEIHMIDKKDFMEWLNKTKKGIVIAGGKEKYNRLFEKYGENWILHNDLFHWMKNVNADWPDGTKIIVKI